MKNNTLPHQVRKQIEEIKNNLLPQALVPNSRLYKNIELVEAEAVLQYAKSLNRKVRKADPGESEFSRINQKQEKAIEPMADYLSIKQAAEIVGLKESTILFYHRKKELEGKKIKTRLYFEKSEVYRFQASRAQNFTS